ncbi:hypothetical protein HPK19_06020 [Arthrobacter citreus]|nr:hypothetical protein HPK19_06020 [Arthrobacter citreus]
MKSLSWDDTVTWTELLGLKTASFLYKGEFNEKAIKACYTKKSILGGEQEGYVIRKLMDLSIKSLNTKWLYLFEKIMCRLMNIR